MPESTPPPPDTTHVSRTHNQSLLECHYSLDKKHRAVLTKDAQGLIRVRCQSWNLSEWNNSGIAFWNPVGEGATITDTIDNARVLARERLIELGATV